METNDLLSMHPDKLYKLHDKLQLVGIILGQLALLDVVTDPKAGATAKAAAGKTLTSTGHDPQVIAERLKQSQFADMSPDELKEWIQQLKDGDATVLEED